MTASSATPDLLNFGESPMSDHIAGDMAGTWDDMLKTQPAATPLSRQLRWLTCPTCIIMFSLLLCDPKQVSLTPLIAWITQTTFGMQDLKAKEKVRHRAANMGGPREVKAGCHRFRLDPWGVSTPHGAAPFLMSRLSTTRAERSELLHAAC